MPGYIHVYTGNGKGKTTAAIGQSIRAAGAGMKIYFAQFVKGQIYSEIKIIKEKLPEIEIEQFGRDCFIKKKPEPEDIKIAREGFETVKNKIFSRAYDLVVLDEINIAIFYDLLTLDEVIDLLNNKPRNLELILTGRRASKAIIEKADLVTEMKEIKHYYKKHIEARPGIEF